MRNMKPPISGIKYILYKSKVVFEKYSFSEKELNDFNIEQIDNNDLLELHMFDEQKEYRVVKSRRKGREEFLFSDIDTPHDDVYIEEVLLINKQNADILENLLETVKIVNYLSYEDDDILHINAYRLQEVK